MILSLLAPLSLVLASQAEPQARAEVGLYLDVSAGFGAGWIHHEGLDGVTRAGGGWSVTGGFGLTSRVRLGLEYASWGVAADRPDVHAHALGLRAELGAHEGAFVATTASVAEAGGPALPYHTGVSVGVATGWRHRTDAFFCLSAEIDVRAQSYGDATMVTSLGVLTLRLDDRPRR